MSGANAGETNEPEFATAGYFASIMCVRDWGQAVALYLAPAIEAKARNRDDVPSIFLINLVLGWTVIGWFAAFVLARRSLGAPVERRKA